MTFLSRRTGLLIAALAQVGVLGYIFAERVRLLTSPTEIVLPVVPVDPRDLFRGDYVILGYDITTIKAPPEVVKEVDLHGQFNVLIEKGADERWTGTLVGAKVPATTPGQLVVKARLAPNQFRRGGLLRTDGVLRVRYGIESYFVPQHSGRALEKQAQERKLSILAAVGSNGELAIKGLMVDGKLVHREATM